MEKILTPKMQHHSSSSMAVVKDILHNNCTVVWYDQKTQSPKKAKKTDQKAKKKA
jgi:predicted CoA-binding protein